MSNANFPRDDEQIKCEFTELPSEYIYFNNGTEGSMPGCVFKAFCIALENWANNPTNAYETDPLLGKRQKENRKALAAILGVKQNNICLTDNTTMGMNLVLMGLDFKAKDRIVITDHEHPCVSSPLWILKRKHGIQTEVRTFPGAQQLCQMNSDELIDFLFPVIPELKNAKALCVSHIYNTTGVRLPLDKLRQRADQLNIRYLIVDGAQALGMVDMSHAENRLDNCDFYAAPMHKWMNGPPGTGILYIKNEYLSPPEFYPILTQKMGSYLCGDMPGTHLPMAEALQVRGCSSIPAFVALRTLMEYYQRQGGQIVIENFIFGLAREISDFIATKAPNCLVSPRDDALRSGLITFFPFKWDQPNTYYTDKETAVSVVDALFKEGLQVRFVPFPTVDLSEECRLQSHNANLLIDCSGEPVDQFFVIRISTAYFNTHDQIEIFKQTLKRVLKKL